MKKFIRWAVCLGLCLGLLVCGALAAESGINVQLDGQNLTFTDAVPQVKDQRTFLPFRAVFEAMGAEVDNKGDVITAVRDGKTLTMTIGSTEATVTEKGVTLPITMDVAPYVDASTWRTYIPVRFAAQAFDCAVGWDQAAQTAVIVDTEKLVKESMEGKTYTYLEQLAAMSRKYQEGIWGMDFSLDADVTMLTAPMMTMDGTVKGVMQDNAKMDMTMNMKMDMDGAMGLASSMGGQSISPEDQAMLNALKTDGVDMALRGDINTGKLYMNMDLGALGTQAGLDSEAWYELDMAALMEQAGLNWRDLMAMNNDIDITDTLAATLAANEPNDAANGYVELKKSFDGLFTAFADDHFQEWGTKVPYNVTARTNHYITTLPDGSKVDVSLNLKKVDEHSEELECYDIIMDLTQEQMTMSITSHVTADGKMTAEIKMDMGGMISLTMTMDGAYTPGTAAPVVTPPDGAKIVSFTELANQTGDLGIIGGADGPTAIFTAKAA